MSWRLVWVKVKTVRSCLIRQKFPLPIPSQNPSGQSFQRKHCPQSSVRSRSKQTTPCRKICPFFSKILIKTSLFALSVEKQHLLSSISECPRYYRIMWDAAFRLQTVRWNRTAVCFCFLLKPLVMVRIFLATQKSCWFTDIRLLLLQYSNIY